MNNGIKNFIINSEVFSNRYLKYIAKSVIELNEKCDLLASLRYRKCRSFTGPDGVLIYLEEDENSDNIDNIFIQELPGERVALKIPDPFYDLNALETWHNAVDFFSNNPSEQKAFLLLGYGQLPLRIAAKIFNIPPELIAEELEEAITHDLEDSFLASTIVRRKTSDPENIIVDVLGLVAWLMQRNPEFLDAAPMQVLTEDN